MAFAIRISNDVAESVCRVLSVAVNGGIAVSEADEKNCKIVLDMLNTEVC